ncbi:LacI family transcriptional regulator [Actinoplanes cyaneus]|jgi:LacI family transcriptional regulator|uniref:LacI family transcriptional regulator n=1 Tax=Actinoplanes cyaneus TaxID=52696 RepID=A0A919IKM3_9ACTN|nr:LacI family DNA-binding transcriptional regulator [Actinoplanes cyaneus]MCW2137620.1 transcriptional regulator, LacI family [Actinoplanes cyaneus]GID65173.1 LacI family transcriptional regulator [Actinoplanes cyaneus]
MVAGKQRVTIAAIADAAGVSVPTVSRVLNGRSDVSPGTRELIERLLREHDYRPRNSRHSGRARLIDLVFNDLDSPWALELVRGVEDVTHAAGVGTVVSQVHRRTTATRQWLQNLRARASDGVVFVTSDVAEPVHSELHRLRVPVVIIDPAGGAATDVPTIGATNWSGGRTATDHLIGLGHRRIGFIAGPKDLLCSRARLDGFRAAMEAAGVPVVPSLMEQGDFRNESGYLAGGRLLDLPDRPTAIFASSDQMALGVYEAARRRGLRVPDDLSVIGFDDLPDACWSSPPLTTIRQPLAEMGSLAARTILRLSRGETIETPRVELVTKLIVRESTTSLAETRLPTTA